MTAPHPRVPRTPRPADPLASDPRHAVYAFDQAVDRIAEEAGFLALGANRQAARYVADAHAVLAEVRTTMHRIDARAHDPMLRKSAKKRLHALAVTVAEAGLRDAEHVTKTARDLNAPATPGVGTALRVQAVKAAAWGVEKWTGSPVVPAQLHSTTAVVAASTVADRIARRGQVPAGRMNRSTARTWRRVGVASAVTGGGALAAYGAWTLAAQLFGLF